MERTLKKRRVAAVMGRWSKSSYALHWRANTRGSRYAGQISLRKVFAGISRRVCMISDRKGSDGTKYWAAIQACFQRRPRPVALSLWHGIDRVTAKRESHHQSKACRSAFGYPIRFLLHFQSIHPHLHTPRSIPSTQDPPSTTNPFNSSRSNICWPGHVRSCPHLPVPRKDHIRVQAGEALEANECG